MPADNDRGRPGEGGPITIAAKRITRKSTRRRRRPAHLAPAVDIRRAARDGGTIVAICGYSETMPPASSGRYGVRRRPCTRRLCPVCIERGIELGLVHRREVTS